MTKETFQIDSEQYNKAYRYSLSLTGNESDAFDLLQTAYGKFLQTSQRKSSLNQGYFYRIIRNHFFDDLKRKKILRLEPLDLDKVLNISGIQELEKELIDKDSIEHILSTISAEERELLYLSAVEEYSVQEISDMTQTSKGTLLSRLHRLKIKIRKKFPSQSMGVK